MTRSRVMGTIYLIHFDEPYQHAQHYLGWSEHAENRMVYHDARLMTAVRNAGIPWRVVRTWQGDRYLERRLHKQHDNRALCPVCYPARRNMKWFYRQHPPQHRP